MIGPVPESKMQIVRSLLLQEPRPSDRSIGRTAGVSQTVVFNERHGCSPKVAPVVISEVSEPIAFEALRKVLKKGGKTVPELADALDCSPQRVRDLLGEMNGKGAMLFERDGRWDLGDSVQIEPGKATIKSAGGMRRFGVLGDNHLCNRHARLDVLKAAYDRYAEEGITDVFNTGNWIDGEARFNKVELIVRPGMDAQLDYMIDNYPQRKGITTHYIAGDDHEGWYQQREGIQIGRYLQSRAEEQGRHDLKYLGYGECDVKLEAPGGSATLRVVHPGGGSAYATSYAIQKLVESYQGGEKPQIIFAGHYHKYESGYWREIWALQTACTCDQSMFLRKNKIQVHVGYLIATIGQDDRGAVNRFSHEFFPFYDRGYYEQRF